MKKKFKWKFDKLFKDAKKKYTPEQVEEMLKISFGSHLIDSILTELFEYKIIKKLDRNVVGLLYHFESWVAPNLYRRGRDSITTKDKFGELCARDIMNYEEILKLRKEQLELPRKEFEVISGIDTKTLKWRREYEDNTKSK